MAVIYEPMTTLVPNTIMQKGIINGVHKVYTIEPVDGFAMHDKFFDSIDYQYDYDENGNEIVTEIILEINYRRTQASVSASYDFTPFTMNDENGNPVTAYGADRQFYCKPETEVPEDNILGGGNNTEIM